MEADARGCLRHARGACNVLLICAANTLVDGIMKTSLRPADAGGTRRARESGCREMVANHEGVPDQGGLKHGIGFGSRAANFESSPLWLRICCSFR
jgi:hypothetical protein